MTLDQLRVCLEYMVLSLGMEDLTYVPCISRTLVVDHDDRDTASSEESERWARFFMDLLRNPGNTDERLLKVHPMIGVMNEYVFPRFHDRPRTFILLDFLCG